MPLDELRRAVAEDRLALLPAELALGGKERHTPREVAAETGLDEGFVLAHRQAMGMPRPGPDDRVLTDDDRAAYRLLKRFRDAGLPEDGLLETGRLLGRAMATVAASSRQLAGAAFLEAGDSELDLGRRYADAARELSPLMGQVLEYHYRLQLREGVRRDAVGRAERESGRLAGATEITAAFADLVGFTRLGEQLPAADLGRLAGRLAVMAGDVATPPVGLVKTIGDAAMLVSPEPLPLLDAVLDLVAAADDEGEDFPQLRGGVASGRALSRGGDWYGSPINLASRITAVARPGSVLATRELREVAGDDGYRWSRAPDRRLKGIEGRVALYRLRRAEASGRGEDDA